MKIDRVSPATSNTRISQARRVERVMGTEPTQPARNSATAGAFAQARVTGVLRTCATAVRPPGNVPWPTD